MLLGPGRHFALEIWGLRNPDDTTDATPLLLSTGPLYGLTGDLASYTVLSVLDKDSVGGANWTSDPRKIIGSGGAVSVKLIDKDGVWGKSLLRSPKLSNWDIQ